VNRGRSGNPRNKKRRQPKQERTLLLGLLVSIALLLVVIIALLPDSVPPAPVVSESSQPSVDDGPFEEPIAESQSDSREQPEVPDVDAADDEPGTGGVIPAPAAADRETPSDHWWLPDDPVPPDERGPLVIVLDDAGNSLDAFAEFLRFPAPIAIAVLPQLDYSVQAAAMTASAGKEIMLHLPMEAVGGADPGPGAIGPSLSSEEIKRRVAENLASVPGAIGVNNHMGSLATADPLVMTAILEELHRRDLFFLDSRTSAQTVARVVAEEIGIPFAERQVFLDNKRSRDEILRALSGGLELAQVGEPVIMIGHATVPLLAAILNEVYPVLDQEGYRFAGISDLVRPVRVVSGD